MELMVVVWRGLPGCCGHVVLFLVILHFGIYAPMDHDLILMYAINSAVALACLHAAAWSCNCCPMRQRSVVCRVCHGHAALFFVILSFMIYDL
jgi:hypothetical protein